MKVYKNKNGLVVEGTKEEIDKIINAKPVSKELLKECEEASKIIKKR